MPHRKLCRIPAVAGMSVGFAVLFVFTACANAWQPVQPPGETPVDGGDAPPPVAPAKEAPFRRGMTIEEARKALDTWAAAHGEPREPGMNAEDETPRLTHRFTIPGDIGTTAVMSGRFSYGVGYYLQFVDGALHRAVPHEPVRWKDGPPTDFGAPTQVMVPMSHDEFIAYVLGHEGVEPGALERLALEETETIREIHRKHMEPIDHLIPEALLKQLAERGRQAEREAAALTRRYDGGKVALGATPEEVGASFGKPIEERRVGNTTVRAYGEEGPLSELFPVVEVEFIDDRAARVFTERRTAK